MRNWRLLAITVAAVIAALTLTLAPLRPILAQASPVKVRVEITDSGFKPKDVTVPAGALVELTFVWAHQGYVNEEHIIALAGYKLDTDTLNSKNREFTMKFIADKPGTFGFKCDVECDLHDYLQNGTLKVSSDGGAGAGAGAAVRTPTTLSLTPSSLVTTGDPVSLMTALRDNAGLPVPKAELRFFLDTEFAGVKDKMDIGTAHTDANGVAFYEYRPTISGQKQTITVRFEGAGVYAESQQAVELQEVGLPPPAYVQEPIGLESIRGRAPLALIAAVLAVWSTFGFVLYQAVGISRVPPRR